MDSLEPRTSTPPLLSKLSEQAPERLDYLGVSFGVTPELFRFWSSSGFVPVYLRQTEVYLEILFILFICLKLVPPKKRHVLYFVL
jgi:hypothetical protein